MSDKIVTVRMRFDKRGGGRYDGREWPAYGELFDVPEWEAQEMFANGDAEPASVPDRPLGWNVLREPSLDWDKPEFATGGVVENDPGEHGNAVPLFLDNSQVIPHYDDDFSFDEPGDDDFGVREPEEDMVARPSANEAKAKWIGWAVANGATYDEANGMTKADLIARYGK